MYLNICYHVNIYGAPLESLRFQMVCSFLTRGEQTTQTPIFVLNLFLFGHLKVPQFCLWRTGDIIINRNHPERVALKTSTETLSWVAHQNRVHKDDLSGGKKDLAVFSFR